jgi:hypothetical protein
MEKIRKRSDTGGAMIINEGTGLKKLDLPMTAFSIAGYGEKLELTIEEVFGFPSQTSYAGGYGAKGSVEINSGSYHVLGYHYFTTGELWAFNQALKDCYDKFSGESILENTERELELVVKFFQTGKVEVRGSFQEQPGIGNELRFEFESDQTCILSAIKDLNKVEKVFGDNFGVKKDH